MLTQTLFTLLLLADPLRIAVSGSLAGQFAEGSCGEAGVSPFEAISAQFEGAADALRFDAGDLLGTASIGRLAVENDAGALARAIGALGLSGLALGHRDLAAPRGVLLALAKALREEAGLRYTLANLRCAPGQALCDLVQQEPIFVDSPSGRIAFIAAISPHALEQAAKDRGLGLELTDPAEALAIATKRARDAGAHKVIAAYDPELGRELEDTIAIALKLDPSASPDAIFVSGIADKLRSAVSAFAETEIVAVPYARVTVAHFQAHDDVAIDRAIPSVPATAITQYASQLNRKLCERYERPFAGAHLDHPLTREDFSDLVLDIMRDHTRAEVAVINRAAVSALAPYPFTGALTPMKLMQALPFDNGLRLTQMRGKELLAVLDGKSAPHFSVRGAEHTEKNGWTINGRPLDPNTDYKVVTTDFVAEGGHGGLGKNLRYDAFGKRSVRAIVQAWLEPKDARQPIDPSERTRWQLFYRLQLDITNVLVVNPNPQSFTDTQLARGQALSITSEAEFRAIGDHPGYANENQLRLRYGLLSTVPPNATPSGLQENTDIATARSLLFYRRLFARAPKWYHPRPYADLYTETELTQPATRPYRHLLLLPTAGLRFELATPFALYVGGGASWEVLARKEQLVPPSDPAAPVLVFGWQLRPTKLIQLGERAITAETNLDVIMRDFGTLTQAMARLRVRFSVPIYSFLTFVVTYDAFLRSLGRQLGYSGDLVVGLSLNYAHALQAFAF